MLATRVMAADGRLIILLGLSEENHRILGTGYDGAIMVEGKALGLAFDLMIFTGKDERTMLADLRDRGVQIGQVRESDPAPPPTAPTPRNAGTGHGGLPEGAMRAAVEAAHAALHEHGVENPAVVLIGQEDGTQRRGLASTVANPDDLLRVVLYNVEQRL